MQPQYVVPGSMGYVPQAGYSVQFQAAPPAPPLQVVRETYEDEVEPEVKQKPKPKPKTKKPKKIAIHPAGVGKILLYNHNNMPISSTPIFLDRRVAIHSENSGIVAQNWPSNARPLPKPKASAAPKPAPKRVVEAAPREILPSAALSPQYVPQQQMYQYQPAPPANAQYVQYTPVTQSAGTFQPAQYVPQPSYYTSSPQPGSYPLTQQPLQYAQQPYV
jgi:hypothetical protein